MVLTHSAPPKKLVFYFGKKTKISNCRLISKLFLHRKFIPFRVLEYSVRAHRFFIVFFIKNGTKMRPKVSVPTDWSPNPAPRHTFGTLRTPFGLPLGSLSAPLGSLLAPLASFWAPLGSLWTSLGSLLAPLGSLLAPLGSLLAPLGSLLPPFGLL